MDIFKQLKDAVSGNKIMEPVNRLNRIAKTIESLRSLLKDNKVSQSVKDRINGLITLVTTKPNITGINHYFNHFLLRLDPENQPPVLKELLEVYHERWKNVERKTARIAYDALILDDEPTFLLHGSEKSVVALFDILMVKQAKVKIFQTISRPGKQGKEQATQLAEAGFEVQLIDDHCIGRVLPEVDFVLLGCEVILHNDFINIPGTHTLIAAAHYYKRPIYVLGDSRRIMNAKYFPQNVLNTLIGESRSMDDKLWEDPPEGITVSSMDKEQIPNYIVDAFILEDSVHTPESLKEEIDKVMVNKFF
ncbi:MAG: hypothetical protein GY751_17655 [Bacteroidetes bacterium]|nr:hypothetical protein [Bacteroidota bacterium]